MGIQEKPQADDRISPVLFAGPFLSEIIFPVYFKVEVRAVKIGDFGMETEGLRGLRGEHLDQFLVFLSEEFEGSKHLVVGEGIIQIQKGQNLMVGPPLTAGIDTPGIDQAGKDFIQVKIKIGGEAVEG
jgi:hypothetical protein